MEDAYRTRFTLYVNQRTRAVLEQLRRELNAASISEVVRRSAEFALWAAEVQARGGRMLTEDSDGRMEAVRV